MRLRRPRHALFALLGLSLLLRGVVYHAFLDTAMPWFPLEATQTDMHATWQWSERILAGDLLGSDTYHPGFEWMAAADREAEWARRWGDLRIFQQEPLYPYFVAALRALLPSPLHAIPLLQLLLGGLLLPLGVHALGRQLIGPRSALCGAALAAVFGPGVFYQLALLRDWAVPVVGAFALSLTLSGLRRRHDGRLFAAGLLLGVGALLKATALLWLPVLGWWLWRTRSAATGLARPARSAGLLTLGLALGLAPIVGRNLAVGAPALALSNRLPEGLIQGNAADACPVGLGHPPSQDATLRAAGGSAAKVVTEILRGYAADPGAFFRVQGAKLRAAFAPVDLADNFAYDYGRERLPALRFCPSWGTLLALAVPGLTLLLARRHLRRPWIVGILAANTVAVLLPIALGRYRLEALPLLALAAGHFLRFLVVTLRARRWNAFALGAGGATGVAILVHATWPPAWLPWSERQALQMVERAAAICIFSDRREHERAADEAAALAAQAGRFPEGDEEATRARLSEVLSLVHAAIEANRTNDESRALRVLERARTRIVGGATERRLPAERVVAFLAQSFPAAVAEQIAALLLSSEPLGPAATATTPSR